jgi:hypothetical protein
MSREASSSSTRRRAAGLTASPGAEPAERTSTASPQGERDVDQADEDGDLDQGSDDPGQGLAGGDAEGRDGHGDGELEVVAGGGEGQRRRALVAQAERVAQEVAAAPHEGEVDEQRQRDPGDVEGRLVIWSPWRAKSRTIVKSSPSRAKGEIRGRKVPSYQARPLVFSPIRAGEVAGEQRHAEEDQDGDGDLPEGDVEGGLLEAEPAGQDGEVEPAERGEGEDLEDRVEGDEDGGGLAVTAGQVVPDDDHGDAAGEADDDQAGAVLGQVGQEDPRQGEHQRGAEDPVEPGSRSSSAVGGDRAEAVVADLGQRRVHHDEQPDRDRQRDAVQLHRVERRRPGPGSCRPRAGRWPSRPRSTPAGSGRAWTAGW